MNNSDIDCKKQHQQALDNIKAARANIVALLDDAIRVNSSLSKNILVKSAIQ